MLATAEATAMQPFTAFESPTTTAQATPLPPPKTSQQTLSQSQQQHAARQAAMDVLSPARSLAFSDQAAANAEAALGPAVRLGDEAHGLIVPSRERSQSHVSVQPPLGPAAEDLVHELLAMNTLAMERGKCGALDEAIALLGEAYEKLSGELAAQRITDEQLLDQLKATTLNNMGVTECHRGQPRHAISHFEAARQLEERWNIASPSLALNSCAAYNALGMYDKATAAALEAIDLLRTLELQRKRAAQLAAASEESAAHAAAAMTATAAVSPSKQFDYTGTLSRNVCLIASNGGNTANADATAGSSSKEGRQNVSSALAASNSAARRTQAETELIAAAAHPAVADSQNAALWGAAWHNLAVAQLNTAREARHALAAGTPTTTSGSAQMEHTNTLVIFQNAMRATQELLGLQHPMSRAVVETFRAARRALQKCGAFKQHHSLLTAPGCALDARTAMEATAQITPWPGCTRHATVQRQQQQLTITFRGEVTGGTAVLERLDPTPYPGAEEEAFRRAPQPRPGASLTGTQEGRQHSHGRRRLHPTRAPRGGSTRPNAAQMRAAEAVYGAPQPTLGASEARTRHAAKGARDDARHTNGEDEEENGNESDTAHVTPPPFAPHPPRSGTRPQPPRRQGGGQQAPHHDYHQQQQQRALRMSQKAASAARSHPLAQSQKGGAGPRVPASPSAAGMSSGEDAAAGNARTAAPTTLPPIHDRRVGNNNSNQHVNAVVAARPPSRNASPNHSAARPQRAGYAATVPGKRGGNGANKRPPPPRSNGAPCSNLYEMPTTAAVEGEDARSGTFGNYAATSPPGPWQSRGAHAPPTHPTTVSDTTKATAAHQAAMQSDMPLRDASDAAMAATTTRELNATQRPSSQRTMTQSRLLLLAEPVALSGQAVRTVYYAVPTAAHAGDAAAAATVTEADTRAMTDKAQNMSPPTTTTMTMTTTRHDAAAAREGNEALGSAPRTETMAAAGTSNAEQEASRVMTTTAAATRETVGTQVDDEAGRLTRRHSATQTPGRDAEVSFDPRAATTAGAAAPETTVNSPHHLFNAMWVAADVGYVRHGKRELGRPGYYISNVMNVDDMGELSREAGGATQPVLVYDSSEASSEASTASGAKQQ